MSLDNVVWKDRGREHIGEERIRIEGNRPKQILEFLFREAIDTFTRDRRRRGGRVLRGRGCRRDRDCLRGGHQAAVRGVR